MDSFGSQITRAKCLFCGPRYFFRVMLLCESMQILEYLGCDGSVTVYFVDLQLLTTVRSSYLSKLCGSMSVLAVEWYLMYLVIHAMQDMRRTVTWAGVTGHR